MNRRRSSLFEHFRFGYRLKSIFRVGVWFRSGSLARNHCLTNRLKGRKLLRSLYPRCARRPLAQALGNLLVSGKLKFCWCKKQGFAGHFRDYKAFPVLSQSIKFHSRFNQGYLYWAIAQTKFFQNFKTPRNEDGLQKFTINVPHRV